MISEIQLHLKRELIVDTKWDKPTSTKLFNICNKGTKEFIVDIEVKYLKVNKEKFYDVKVLKAVDHPKLKLALDYVKGRIDYFAQRHNIITEWELDSEEILLLLEKIEFTGIEENKGETGDE